MSDCIECWETPCVCGHNYQNWSIESLQKQIKMLQGVLTKKEAKTFQRTNWSNEQILKFLDGQKIINGEGIVDNYCQDHNDVIEDIKDFFYDFMRPETEFGATGYCVEEDTVYHIGGLPEPLRVPIEEEKQ